MEYTDLLRILHGDISHINEVNADDVALYETNVTIKPTNVREILCKYLSGDVNAAQLVGWAKFICSRGEYICPNWEDDNFSDYYEDMFYVIQRLSTPEIDGEINNKRIKQYIVELEKHSDD